MLPVENRLTASESFRLAVRRGRRSGSRTIVLHLDGDAADAPCRVGFVTSKAVGGAVVRNRVKRRLRHLVADRLEELPGHGVLVVRAQPAAAGSDYQALGTDLERCLARLTRGAA